MNRAARRARRGARSVLHAAAAPLRLRLYRDGLGAGLAARLPAPVAELLGVDGVSDVGTRRLEIGSGIRPAPGFIHIDTDRRAPHVEVSAPAWRLPFPDGWADEIRAVHVLEHVEVRRLETTLREWRRVLRPGGFVQIHVPNGPQLAQAFVSGSLRDQWRAVAALMGTDAQPTLEGPEDFRSAAEHQVIFSETMLADLLERARFSRHEDVTDSVADAHTEGWSDLVPRCSMVIRAYA